MKILIVLLSLTFTYAFELSTVNGRIKISVVTTAGCSDTTRFISNLADTFKDYGQFIDLEFIPWGRTVRNSDGSQTCQFGERDCWANRLHRCALKDLTTNQAKMDYMLCEFSSPFPSYLSNTYHCAAESGISIRDVDYCVSLGPSDDLDLEAEEAAREPMSVINFVPSVYFNDEVDLALHREALTSLKSVVCFALAADPTTGVVGCSL